MKKHNPRWRNVWGEVRLTTVDGVLYHDFVLWAGHHYVRHRASDDQVRRNPDIHKLIFDELTEKVSVSMQKGGWFG